MSKEPKKVEKIYGPECLAKFEMTELRHGNRARLSNHGKRWSDSSREQVVCKFEYHGADNARMKVAYRDSRTGKFLVFRADASELSDIYTLLHGLAETTNLFSVPVELTQEEVDADERELD